MTSLGILVLPNGENKDCLLEDLVFLIKLAQQFANLTGWGGGGGVILHCLRSNV